MMTPGQTFQNGCEVYAVALDWRAALTVRRISEGYGVTRYLVSESQWPAWLGLRKMIAIVGNCE